MGELLTERKVAEFVKAGLPEGKASAILWSGAVNGFGLRLRKGGAASWIFLLPAERGRSQRLRSHRHLGLVSLARAQISRSYGEGAGWRDRERTGPRSQSTH